MRKVNFFAKFIFFGILISGIFSTQGLAATECDTCIPCHGNLEDVHNNYSHSASLGNGWTQFFYDNSHDSAADEYWVNVDCATCHSNDLPAVHGNDCATCHPTPYDTLGLWNKGCQQGGCHPFYHGDSPEAHLPYASTREPVTDCNTCHGGGWAVTIEACLNCHDANVANDVTQPTSSSDVQAQYIGPAKIDFSITDDSKVGVGRIFYQLDSGPVTAAGKHLYVEEPGPHDLIFWAKDQHGNTEAAQNSVFFDIIADNEAPTTTSDAQSHYGQGGLIRLTATDNGTLGVKRTYYQIDDGAVQSGTYVSVPRDAGMFTYTLKYWSEDYSGNVETKNSVTFSVTSGTGIIRFDWGGPSSTGDALEWMVKVEDSRGKTVASGSVSHPWNGIVDVEVPISSKPYWAHIVWYSGGESDGVAFDNVYVTEPGEIVYP